MTKHLSLDEIAERLALPKTTVYYWIADLPLGRPRRENPHPGTRAMQRKYQRLRDDAYATGLLEYDTLATCRVGYRCSRAAPSLPEPG